MANEIDSRLEGGPFDGELGAVEEPAPEVLHLWRCGAHCPCSSKSGLHYYADGRPGGVAYRLAGINEAGWAVYWYGAIDASPLRSAARELILT